MPELLSPHAAASEINGTVEVGCLDVREAGQFGEGHALFAVPAPYSRLELDLPGIAPRLTARLILIDDGDGVAHKAASRLADLGYGDVAIVDGGMPAWSAAGLIVVKGVNVPGKLLGELVEHILHPPTITPETLEAWRREGRRFHLFDARPPAEYAKMRLPGAACLPNGELAHRFDAAVPDDGAPVIVNCAGRTRGLIGVAGLRLAGITAPMFALENGTQGWTLAGLELERTNTPESFPRLDDRALAASRRRAEALINDKSLQTVDAATVGAWLAGPDRTTYLFDVRSSPEAAADPVPAATHALGVQLVQATDQFVAVRRSRIVLACDTGLRAALAAYWLGLLGYDTAVCLIDDALRRLPARPAPAPPARPTAISPDACHRLLGMDQADVLDLAPSRTYRTGHATGARWAIRPRLPEARGRTVCLMADDPGVAALAARDVAEQGAAAVRWVEGGLRAWRTAGLATESSPDVPSDTHAIDYLLFVHDRHDGNLDACRRYLAWEQGLIVQISPEERRQFRL